MTRLHTKLHRAFPWLRPVLSAWVLLCVAAMAPAAVAQTEDKSEKFAAWTAEIESAEARLSDPTLSEFTIDRWVDQLEKLVIDVRDVAEQSRNLAAPIASQLDALGPLPEDGGVEAESLSQERSALQSTFASYESDARRAEAMVARAEQLLDRLRDWRRGEFAQRLLTRSPSPLWPHSIRLAIIEIGDALNRGREQHIGVVRRLSEEGLLTTAVLGFSVGLGVAVALILLLRKVVIRRLVASVSRDASQMRKLLVAVALAASRLLIPLVAIAVIDRTLERFAEFGIGDLTALNAALSGAATIIVVYALAYTYYAPRNPTLRLADVDESRANRAANWAVVLAAIWAVDTLLIAFAGMHSLGDEALALANLIVVSISALAFWRFVAVNRMPRQDAISKGEEFQQDKPAEDLDDEEEEAQRKGEPVEVSLGRFARMSAMAFAIFSPLAALAGFYALSRYTIENIALTTALFGICKMLYAAVRSGVDALAYSSGAEQKEGARAADFSLAPIVFGTFLAIAAAPVVALIWGVTEDDLFTTYRSIADGISVGDITFSPIDVAVFIVIFIIGVVLTRTVQSILRGTILPRTKLDEGAQASLVSGSSYVGFTLAALAAIGAAGLDLSNIAIVAGALSVGIGFGLQNVVNNFVSGVILLVERPVKIGDWVVVAGEHGYVRKINVRSTEIQTFDRTTLIVPNSELISSTVTNYTHNDVIGRVIAPIGVAYGTDPRKVERILQEVARANHLLRRYPPPQVLFMGFGDSSLDFELRGILRDVNQIIAARSAINFEIARRFAEEGIEIPFPQRDVNLRDIDRLAAAIRGETAPDAG